MTVAGRTVLLTGATGGLGQALARRLSREGARLLVSGRRTDVLEPLAAELGGRALAADLADPASVDRLAGESAAADILVANAGVPASGHLMSFTVEEIDRALAVNLRAPMILARRLGEQMAERGSGHIVFMSSLSGKVGTPGSSVYSATKFGLRGFAQALRADLRGHGVGVSVVLPGFIRDAGMFADSGAKLPAWVGLSSPEEVAGAVVHAIEHNRGEVEVGPVVLRVGARVAGLAPELVATLSRRLGSERIASDMGARQTEKR